MVKPQQLIHVVFKTHLDIGYTDLAHNVAERYRNVFIPKSIAAAEYFEKHPEKGSFIWTTGSWLIHDILKYGSVEQIQKLEEAIRKGYLKWHGLPFTTHSELLDPLLLEYGLSLSKELDTRFGTKTIAAKMTDVPGHTRSIITHLAKVGIKYLHLGVNGSSHVPHLPEVFLWRNTDGSEIVVQYSKDYGSSFQVDGLQDVLHFAHTHDNHGPSSVDQIEQQFKELRATYPDAVIEASTLDRYAEKLWDYRGSLPVVEQEIGDSWIHGGASDPYKIACYRELLRLRSKWLEDGVWTTEDEEYRSFCDGLIMIPEHTWGMDIKRYLADYAHYEKKDFNAARTMDKVDTSLNPMEYRYQEEYVNLEIIEMFQETAEEKFASRSYSLMERSWNEQRDYLKKAIDALHSERRLEAEAALKRLEPKRASDSTEATELFVDETYQLGSFEVVFTAEGSISGLKDSTGREWAGTANPIGLFTYETYSQEDYDRWFREYHVRWKQTHFWAVGDFGKPGMELTSKWITHQSIKPKLLSIIHQQTELVDIVHLKLKMSKTATGEMGAPRELVIEYLFPKDSTTIEINLKWFDKDAHRLPEASWFTFNPAVDNPNQWKLDKLGQLLSPLEVVKGGNRNMHAVNRGMFYQGADGEVSIETLDAPMVCPGQRRLLQFDHTFAPLAGGMHMNLHNNVWGTNFRAWYSDDAQFRFKLKFKSYF